MASSRLRRLSAMASSIPSAVSGCAASAMSPASLSTSATRSWRPATSASFSRPCTSSRSAMSRLRARSWSIGPSFLVGRLGVHVIVFVAVGRAAHHPQHSEPAGAEESDDQRGGEEQKTMFSQDRPGTHPGTGRCGGSTATASLSNWSEHRRRRSRWHPIATPRMTPSQAAPTYSGPKQAAPTYSGPKQAAPTNSGPKQAAPTNSGPKQAAPTNSGPKQAAPTYSGPKQAAPTNSGPKQAAPTYSGPSRAE